MDETLRSRRSPCLQKPRRNCAAPRSVPPRSAIVTPTFISGGLFPFASVSALCDIFRDLIICSCWTAFRQRPRVSHAARKHLVAATFPTSNPLPRRISPDRKGHSPVLQRPARDLGQSAGFFGPPFALASTCRCFSPSTLHVQKHQDVRRQSIASFKASLLLPFIRAQC